MPLDDLRIVDSLSIVAQTNMVSITVKSARRNVPFLSCMGIAAQMRMMSDHADKIFDELLDAIDPIEIRLNNLSKRVSKRTHLHDDQCPDLSTDYVDDNIITVAVASDNCPYTRSSSVHHGGDLRTQGKEMALLGRLDDLIAGGKCEQPGPCSRGFSDPTFFYVKWRSQQESYLAEMHAKQFVRRHNKVNRRVLMPKTIPGADSMQCIGKIKIPIVKIGLERIVESDETEDAGNKKNRIVVDSLDPKLKKESAATHCLLSERPQDSPISGNLQLGEESVLITLPPVPTTSQRPWPPPPPPPPPSLQMEQPISATCEFNGDDSVCPAPVLKTTSRSESNSAAQSHSKAKPLPLRPKSVIFCEDLGLSLQSQGIKRDDSSSVITSTSGEQLDIASTKDSEPCFNPSQKHLIESTAMPVVRPVSRRLRPQSIDLRRQLQKAQELNMSSNVAKPTVINSSILSSLEISLHPLRVGDRAMADHFAVSSNRSSLCEAIRSRGDLSSNKFNTSDRRASEPNPSESRYPSRRGSELEEQRSSLGMLGGSAVSAILARRKYLQHDKDISDSDSGDDSISDWS